MPPGQEATPPTLETTCERKLSTTVMSLRPEHLPRHLLAQGKTALLPDPAYFKVKSTDELLPGDDAVAEWVVWDGDGESLSTRGTDWGVVASPFDLETTIYDPRHLALALANEIVKCEWNCERERWEVYEEQGLRRHGKTSELIAYDSVGDCVVYHDEAATNTTVEVELKWMHEDTSLASGIEVSFWYNRAEERWLFDGAECP